MQVFYQENLQQKVDFKLTFLKDHRKLTSISKSFIKKIFKKEEYKIFPN